jgi:hypothetical protein
VTLIQRKDKQSDKATGSRTGYHVGFLVSVTPQRIRLLGGNQGDQVKYSSFSRASYDIRGYRWPTLQLLTRRRLSTIEWVSLGRFFFRICDVVIDAN